MRELAKTGLGNLSALLRFKSFILLRHRSTTFLPDDVILDVTIVLDLLPLIKAS